MNDNAPEDKTNESKKASLHYKVYSEVTNEFAEFTHAYIHDNIWRADQKSTIMFTFLLFTYLFILNPTYKWYGNSLFDLLQCNFNYGKVLIYAMIFSFASSIIFIFLTIFPRLKVRSYSIYDDLSNLLYWESILKNFKLKEYVANIKNRTPDDLVQIKLEHCYEIALVCKKKHRTLQFAMIAAISGVILFLLMQLWLAKSPISFGLTKPSSGLSVCAPRQI